MKSPYNRILPSLRLVEMPSYAFGQLDEIKMELIQKGQQLIDLSLGSPDHPTHPQVLEALTKGMQKLRNQQYPIFSGLPSFKEACAQWFKQRFNVQLDPKTNILPLNGSKEGIAHIAFAYMQEGFLTIIPSPYYPVHMRGTLLAGGNVYEMKLKPENGYIADLDSIPEDILVRAKIMIISYPHNPTGAVVDKAYLQKAVNICKEYNILLINDFAYSEIWFDNNRPHSILEVRGGMDVAIEFHTFSKTYNMAGMRLGFAVGNPEIIQTLYKLKTNIDYGVCMGIQEAGIAAIELGDEYRESIRLEYQNRRNYVFTKMHEMGFDVMNPGGAMYTWIPIPERFKVANKNSFDFALEVLRETGVALVPGLTFGRYGEDFVRLAFVQNLERTQIAMERLGNYISSKV